MAEDQLASTPAQDKARKLREQFERAIDQAFFPVQTLAKIMEDGATLVDPGGTSIILTGTIEYAIRQLMDYWVSEVARGCLAVDS